MKLIGFRALSYILSIELYLFVQKLYGITDVGKYMPPAIGWIAGGYDLLSGAGGVRTLVQTRN